MENDVALPVGGERIAVRAEGDNERTRASDGKASAGHYFHVDFTSAQIARWPTGEGTVLLAIDHPLYGYAAVFGAESRAYLGRECFA